MIKNGYYYPVEYYNSLTHRNESGGIEGNAQIGVVMGNRSGGKTVGHGLHLLDKFMTQGESSMILARTDKQVGKHYIDKWIRKTLVADDADGIVRRFLSMYREKGKTTDAAITIGNDPVLYCEAISMSKDVKDHGVYLKCSDIYMDEAVQAGERSLIIMGRSAMARVFEIFDTVARGWPDAYKLTHLNFLANVSDRDNWIFNDLRINDFVRADTKFTTQYGITVEMVNNKIVAKEHATSLIGEAMQRSISGREYYESAHRNAFADNTAFVKSCGLDFRKLKIQLIVREHCLGVFETDTGLHVAKIEQDSRSPKICNNAKYHSEEIKLSHNGEWEIKLRQNYEAGRITFQTLEAKNLLLEFCSIKF